MSEFPRRMRALFLKEMRQLLRDRYSLAIGIFLPLVLLLLFGYGMSMDLKEIKLAISMPESSPESLELLAKFRSSGYFTVTRTANPDEARAMIVDHRCDAALFLPTNYGRKHADQSFKLLLAVNATNPNQARLTENYVQGVLGKLYGKSDLVEPARLLTRIWFNDANDSRYYLVPGVIVIIMTLIGAMLTSLVMAREYEQGTLESLFISPVHPVEILLAKAANNFLLGMAGLVMALLTTRYLFDVPLRGSLIVMVAGSCLFLLVALGMGLVISSLAKNQFVACQITLSVTFMPAFMLSGFLYEIDNMPYPVQLVTYIVPARYFVEFLQTVFLAGNVWCILIKDMAILAIYAVVFLTLARLKTPKLLE